MLKSKDTDSFYRQRFHCYWPIWWRECMKENRLVQCGSTSGVLCHCWLLDTVAWKQPRSVHWWHSMILCITRHALTCTASQSSTAWDVPASGRPRFSILVCLNYHSHSNTSRSSRFSKIQEVAAVWMWSMPGLDQCSAKCGRCTRGGTWKDFGAMLCSAGSLVFTVCCDYVSPPVSDIEIFIFM